MNVDAKLGFTMKNERCVAVGMQGHRSSMELCRLESNLLTAVRHIKGKALQGWDKLYSGEQ